MIGGTGLGVFGDRVREGRESKRRADGKRWTQRDLADAVGVDENTVGNWESGRTEPGLPTKRAVAAALDLSFEWVNGESNTNPGPVAVDHTVREESRARYPSRLDRLPPRVYEVVYGYTEKLRAIGLTADEIDEAERTLREGAFNKINSREPGEKSEEDMILDIKAAWQFVRDVVNRNGKKL